MSRGDTEAEFSGSIYTLTVEILDSDATPDPANKYRIHVSTINYLTGTFKLNLRLTRLELHEWLFVV